MDLCLIPTGKKEEEEEGEVVNIHPRTMFIPQEGWSFLSAGKTRSNSVPGEFVQHFQVLWPHQMESTYENYMFVSNF